MFLTIPHTGETRLIFVDDRGANFWRIQDHDLPPRSFPTTASRYLSSKGGGDENVGRLGTSLRGTVLLPADDAPGNPESVSSPFQIGN